MSKFKDFQQKTFSIFKRPHFEREEFRFSTKFAENTPPSSNEEKPRNLRDEYENTAHALLIDHELLKPLSLMINRYVAFYSTLVLWVCLMTSANVKMRWFLVGLSTSTVAFALLVLYLHMKEQPSIDYRQKLLLYYGKELDRIRMASPMVQVRPIPDGNTRRGWMYISENYDLATFKMTDVVLSYAILSGDVFTIYVVDDKFSLKPKQGLETFTNLLKKMKSSHKIALDTSEMALELLPEDLAMGRIWNRRCPIKVTTQKMVCFEVDAPASSFIDLVNVSEPFAVPSYHRQTPFKVPAKEIYLYGINSREKERWYYKISKCSSLMKRQRELNKYVANSNLSSYNTYLENIMRKGRWIHEKLTINVKNKAGTSVEEGSTNMLLASSMFSLNVIFSRLFWDFWREQSWNAHILARIQRSLNRIPLPQYLKYLKAHDLNMGDSLPLLFSAETPTLDDDGGFWINCPIYYEGKFSLTITTQIISDLYSLMLERSKGVASGDPTLVLESTETPTDDLMASVSYRVPPDSCHLDSEYLIQRPSRNSLDTTVSTNALSLGSHSLSAQNLSEDLAEVKSLREVVDTRTKRLKNNLAKFITDNKEALKSKASDYAKKLCKTAANHFENSILSLHVTVTLVKGTVALYFPPPPTNRVWFGFRTMPVVVINTKSKIGTGKSMKFPIVTQWIERKLKEEIKDVFVLPSMEDLYVPFLSANLPPR